jgi:hypothetical protein
MTIHRLLSANLAAINITEKEAYDTCWQLIVNEKNLGPSCLQSSTQNPDTAEKMVQMCAADVMVTRNTLQAYLFNIVIDRLWRWRRCLNLMTKESS